VQEFHRALSHLGIDQFSLYFPLLLLISPSSICLRSSCASQFPSIVAFEFCGCHTRFPPEFCQLLERALVGHQSNDVFQRSDMNSFLLHQSSFEMAMVGGKLGSMCFWEVEWLEAWLR